MIKKSTKNISLDFILEKFNFIEEGSMIINYNNKYFMACCKNTTTISDLGPNLTFKVAFNPIMQGDFPTLEVKIEFFHKSIKIDEISNLISINNFHEIKEMYSFLLNKDLPIIILNKKNKSLQIFEIKNNFTDEYLINLKNFQIDIKDIIKNTNN